MYDVDSSKITCHLVIFNQGKWMFVWCACIFYEIVPVVINRLASNALECTAEKLSNSLQREGGRTLVVAAKSS